MYKPEIMKLDQPYSIFLRTNVCAFQVVHNGTSSKLEKSNACELWSVTRKKKKEKRLTEK